MAFTAHFGGFSTAWRCFFHVHHTSRGTAAKWCTKVTEKQGLADFCFSWPRVTLEPSAPAPQEGWQRGHAPAWVPLGLLTRGRTGKHFTCLVRGMRLMSNSTQGEQGAGRVPRSVPFPPPASFEPGCCRGGCPQLIWPSTSRPPGRSVNKPQRLRIALHAHNRFYLT